MENWSVISLRSRSDRSRDRAGSSVHRVRPLSPPHDDDGQQQPLQAADRAHHAALLRVCGAALPVAALARAGVISNAGAVGRTVGCVRRRRQVGPQVFGGVVRVRAVGRAAGGPARGGHRHHVVCTSVVHQLLVLDGGQGVSIEHGVLDCALTVHQAYAVGRLAGVAQGQRSSQHVGGHVGTADEQEVTGSQLGSAGEGEGGTPGAGRRLDGPAVQSLRHSACIGQLDPLVAGVGALGVREDFIDLHRGAAGLACHGLDGGIGLTGGGIRRDYPIGPGGVGVVAILHPLKRFAVSGLGSQGGCDGAGVVGPRVAVGTAIDHRVRHAVPAMQQLQSIGVGRGGAHVHGHDQVDVIGSFLAHNQVGAWRDLPQCRDVDGPLAGGRRAVAQAPAVEGPGLGAGVVQLDPLGIFDTGALRHGGVRDELVELDIVHSRAVRLAAGGVGLPRRREVEGREVGGTVVGVHAVLGPPDADVGRGCAAHGGQGTVLVAPVQVVGAAVDGDVHGDTVAVEFDLIDAGGVVAEVQVGDDVGLRHCGLAHHQERVGPYPRVDWQGDGSGRGVRLAVDEFPA